MRALLGELVGTALLLAAVVGGAIAGDRLASGEPALALLIGALVTGLALGAVIGALQPVSGAHLNPAVTLAATLGGAMRPRLAVAYGAVQIVGALTGTIVAHVMFAARLVTVAGIPREGMHLLLAEAAATFGLVLVIEAAVRAGRSAALGLIVGAYVAAAYFFIASTGFANPAVTVARMFTGSSAGIAPASAVGFVVAQVLGAVFASVTARALYPASTPR